MTNRRKVMAVVSLDNKVIQKQFSFVGIADDKYIDETVNSWADGLIHKYWIEIDEEEEEENE